LQGLRGIIACSSSSAITKRFAFNRFDRDLVDKLISSEDQLISSCRRLSIPCCVLRPSMIYGQVGIYRDRNLSRLLQFLRCLPVLPLPAESGLRQPIHASQLAAVTLHLAEEFAGACWDPSLPDRIAVGGDTTLTYAEMISALQQAQPLGDSASRCRLLSIPNRLFFFLSVPLLLRSPKAFEAVLRMGANLSGFTPAHQLLGSEPQSFPVLPLA
jgi:nucleoside-diphosphate-sugar epimerase